MQENKEMQSLLQFDQDLGLRWAKLYIIKDDDTLRLIPEIKYYFERLDEFSEELVSQNEEKE